MKDSDGNKHSLWDYRQKSHVVLIYDPQRDQQTHGHWQQAIAADRAQWDWLNVKLLIISEGPKEMEPGIYAIDRYGHLINSFPIDHWNFNDLEREYIYLEARHC